MSRKKLQPCLFCSSPSKEPRSLAVSLTMVILALLMIVNMVPAQPLPPAAFPGAEGFGAMSAGGRGGSLIEVTNLNDNGPGSLRDAIEASGPRTVVFRIGGTIELQSPLIIINPFITIAGQTAPGGGITLKNAANTSTSLSIQTNDVIIRYLRVRPGPGGEPDGINILYDQSYNVILDHCSVSWAVDENISTWFGPRDITIQWCIINEGLRFSTHSKGSHSTGMLLGSDGSHNISVHHNLFVHNNTRNPQIKTSGLVDFVNNVIYNFGEEAGALRNEFADLPVNYIGNYVKGGPDSEAGEYEVDMSSSNKFIYSVYVGGNIGPHRPNDSYDEAAVVSPEDRQYLNDTPHPAPPITTTSAQEAYEQVLANAGAAIGIDGQGRSFWRRDPVDVRVVNDARNGTGRIIDDPDDVGGWPELEAGIPPSDSDHDGMPDDWEVLNGFDPLDPTDGPADRDGDGYTNLESALFPLPLPVNLAPTVEAEPDQNITVSDTADLAGTVSDDGLPDPPGILTTTWRQMSGPGTVSIADANAASTSASFSAPGTYILRLTADDGQLATSDEMTVIVTGAGGEIVTEVRVATGSDDAEESSSGSISLSSSDLELVNDGSDQAVGLRFNGVDIPPGATIVQAYIQFQTDEATTEDTSLTILGEAADNAAPFTTATGNISSRLNTMEAVPWFPVPWPIVGEANPDQRTADIAFIIQEIVEQPGWSAGNSLVIIITGTGKRVAESYDGDPGGAPLLRMVYIPDTTPPTITAFDLPADSTSLTVPILNFTATDNVEVTGYLATESSTAPAADDSGWSDSPPDSYTFATVGSQMLYGWVKDAAGNVSASLSDTVTINVDDTAPPIVTDFDLPETATILTVPILTFTATDDTGVTGYLASESASTPAPYDHGWSATTPVAHTFGSDGSQTLYGWAKDAFGNVSTSLSDTVIIDIVAPVVTAFDLPATANSLTVAIDTFTATDNVAVTGYLASESATSPAPDAPGWSTTPPTAHTFTSDGSHTLYGWAKDHAGNVSAALSDTVMISLPDTEAPTVTAFDLPATANSLTVSIDTFTATDNVAVTGYLATESATSPAPDAPDWSATPPTEHTFSNEGSHTLYGWAKDTAGNVSTSLSDLVTITLPDTEAPTVTAFDLPASSDSLTVAIDTFTATDNVAVTGYLATESVSPPAPDAPGWSATPPAEYTFTSEGSHTLYGWAKDAAGNVSTSLSDTVTITLPDTEAPTVTAFDLPDTATTLTVPILTFTATDNVAVTGYLASESATSPAPDAPGWSATPPTAHTFTSDGTHTLYGWAKDPAGNVSAALSDTVMISLPDTEAPTMTAFDLPDTATTLTVPILAFSATDNVAVTGYLATESATPPAPDDTGWSGSPPNSYSFTAEGSHTLYGWAKDAAGNVSISLSDTVTITLPDTEAPTMTAFDLPATANSLTVSIDTFTATDDTGVTGYLATESATPQAPDAPGWSATPPTEHTFRSDGSQTLYGWAKDAAGNVSTSLSDTVTISLGATMHVGDLDSSVKVRGKSGKWAVFVTVTVHNQNHSPLASAAVSGTWSGATSGTISGTTDGLGTVTFGTDNLGDGNTVVFGVTDVSLADFTYNNNANHDPDGDSDGSIITVSKALE